ncbi:MAG: bifunctional 3-deoxy-7-phosphoheptulonate synthase/chorismate mutase type II [Planctomycetaceae bacterium]|jgi:chorismate mutase|nr:bifunctional 3-deoxy-7-phosphoheptulonate synthase/chorismate mutase type II [Planctomycetaceae bacterium]
MNIESILLPGIDPKRPVVISGPCSAESEGQCLDIARGLSKIGVKIFRAGIWKPRTKPGGFEGMGAKALPWLKKIKEETSMYTATEVATKDHVFAALKAGIDILWVGARTTANPFAVQEVADAISGADVPVLIKNPVNPDLELWVGGIERLYGAGIKKIGAIHRGFGLYEKKLYRNEPMWHIPIELRRRMPELPLFCDPSHIGGRREYIAEISQQAMDLCFDGLMIESHCCPDKALSDASQQITPEMLDHLLSLLVVRDAFRPSKDLSEMRVKIDQIDTQIVDLLGKRMEICDEIGHYKKEHNMPVLQPVRYGETLRDRAETGLSKHLDPAFVREIIKEIHEESVRRQLAILNG